MSDLDKNQQQRRKVVTLLGTGAVALPVLGLSGCGGDSAETTAAGSAQQSAADVATAMQDTAKEVQAATEEAVQDTVEAVEEAVEEVKEQATVIAKDTTTNLPNVDENGAQAQGLSYRHDATTVDASVQTRYAAGQQCSNCALYQGGDAQWGGCPIFAGQNVNRNGWCSAYVAAG